MTLTVKIKLNQLQGKVLNGAATNKLGEGEVERFLVDSLQLEKKCKKNKTIEKDEEVFKIY